jgi:hypothetical protein
MCDVNIDVNVWQKLPIELTALILGWRCISNMNDYFAKHNQLAILNNLHNNDAAISGSFIMACALEESYGLAQTRPVQIPRQMAVSDIDIFIPYTSTKTFYYIDELALAVNEYLNNKLDKLWCKQYISPMGGSHDDIHTIFINNEKIGYTDVLPIFKLAVETLLEGIRRNVHSQHYYGNLSWKCESKNNEIRISIFSDAELPIQPLEEIIFNNINPSSTFTRVKCDYSFPMFNIKYCRYITLIDKHTTLTPSILSIPPISMSQKPFNIIVVGEPGFMGCIDYFDADLCKFYYDGNLCPEFYHDIVSLFNKHMTMTINWPNSIKCDNVKEYYYNWKSGCSPRNFYDNNSEDERQAQQTLMRYIKYVKRGFIVRLLQNTNCYNDKLITQKI